MSADWMDHLQARIEKLEAKAEVFDAVVGVVREAAQFARRPLEENANKELYAAWRYLDTLNPEVRALLADLATVTSDVFTLDWKNPLTGAADPEDCYLTAEELIAKCEAEDDED